MEINIFSSVYCIQFWLNVIIIEILIFLGGRKVFRSFLRCEYSEENILFWLACEELRKERNNDRVEERARMIYEEYVSILSPREVNSNVQS